MNPNDNDQHPKDSKETKWVIWIFLSFVILGIISIGLFMYYYLMRL
ncbi:hypothetical protein [Ammoniphilus sp. 3BR4]